ncbi:MAG: glycine--tRNA ligase [Candidatus Bathyarchaeota archaeon]|nr:glycine--tRNA ligase [Candidatus Bathyarchaeota archaeon]MDH5746460.1 glycine--tRNA ligase [Candidatus Bathyarchaeota archaeon]
MTDGTKTPDKFTIINELARRRGFFWQSYEIYGGVSGFVTYGFLGAKLKQKIESKLRELFVSKLGILEIESPVISPSKVFEASGHVDHFKEPMVECQKCKKRFRADHLLREFAKISEAEAEKLSLKELKETMEKNEIRCPECSGTFGEPKYFLTMFKTTIGPYSEAVGYGRPEAAQGIFVEFRRLCEMAREKLPFGVIQIGHALRNEISPRQGLIRLREFTIIDLEFFFDPEESDCFLLKNVEGETLRLFLAENKLRGSEEIVEITVKEALEKGYIKAEWQAVFMALAKKLLADLGVPPEKQRFIEKLPWERAHYALQSFDQEVYVERWGWVEVSGHAYRTDYDLKRHMKFSGVDMRVFKEYEKPLEREQAFIKPLMAKLGPIFKTEAAEVAEMISGVDPCEVASSIKKDGYYMLGECKILPEHVEITRRKVKEQGKRFFPHVVEPSFGSDRLVYVALEYAYRIKDDRAILSFPRDIAPMQVGVYPLVSKDGLPEKALQVYRMLLNEGFIVEYDEAGSIGRRYARADEIGIPLGITVDYETLKDNTVTIRDRDSWKQVRTRVIDLPELLHKYFRWKANFEDLGKPFEG